MHRQVTCHCGSAGFGSSQHAGLDCTGGVGACAGIVIFSWSRCHVRVAAIVVRLQTPPCVALLCLPCQFRLRYCRHAITERPRTGRAPIGAGRNASSMARRYPLSVPAHLTPRLPLPQGIAFQGRTVRRRRCGRRCRPRRRYRSDDVFCRSVDPEVRCPSALCPLADCRPH